MKRKSWKISRIRKRREMKRRKAREKLKKERREKEAISEGGKLDEEEEMEN